MQARLLAPKGGRALEYRIRRKASGIWQWALFAGDEMISHWQGMWRGPDGERNCLARIALIQTAGAKTPIRKVLST